MAISEKIIINYFNWKKNKRQALFLAFCRIQQTEVSLAIGTLFFAAVFV